MRKLTLLISLLCVIGISAQVQNPAYIAYIQKWRMAALQQEKAYHIPAAITMAQGLLESGAGTSTLAREGNNHFGIKCGGGWTGETITHDDETRNECFRKYKDASESYEDHSQFLLKTRYQSLFLLDIKDYVGWANGLSRCGYATDPAYPSKLIRLIDDYQLAQLDNDSIFGKKEVKEVKKETVKKAEPKKKETVKKAEAKKKESVKKVEKGAAARPSVEAEDVVSAGMIAGAKIESGFDEVPLFVQHTREWQNGVPYVVAEAGDTFQSLAIELGISEARLRKYNDVPLTYQPNAGDRVYLFTKKRKVTSGPDVYRVKEGDSAWSIAQRFGIRLKSLYDMNGIARGTGVHYNQELRLR